MNIYVLSLLLHFSITNPETASTRTTMMSVLWHESKEYHKPEISLQSSCQHPVRAPTSLQTTVSLPSYCHHSKPQAKLLRTHHMSKLFGITTVCQAPCKALRGQMTASSRSSARSQTDLRIKHTQVQFRK